MSRSTKWSNSGRLTKRMAFSRAGLSSFTQPSEESSNSPGGKRPFTPSAASAAASAARRSAVRSSTRMGSTSWQNPSKSSSGELPSSASHSTFSRSIPAHSSSDMSGIPRILVNPRSSSISSPPLQSTSTTRNIASSVTSVSSTPRGAPWPSSTLLAVGSGTWLIAPLPTWAGARARGPSLRARRAAHCAQCTAVPRHRLPRHPPCGLGSAGLRSLWKPSGRHCTGSASELTHSSVASKHFIDP